MKGNFPEGQDGRKINDSRRNERSVAVTEELEREYGLHPAKGAVHLCAGGPTGGIDVGGWYESLVELTQYLDFPGKFQSQAIALGYQVALVEHTGLDHIGPAQQLGAIIWVLGVLAP